MLQYSLYRDDLVLRGAKITSMFFGPGKIRVLVVDFHKIAKR